jgi:glycosyltransferase involved in cell wall biosynthesis
MENVHLDAHHLQSLQVHSTRHGMKIDALIPALNEEASMAYVIEGLKGRGLRRIVVADNGSTDGTAQCARSAGAEVTSAPQRGYGSACLAGLSYMAGMPPDVVVFLDGDGADNPDDLTALLAPILRGDADFVIGSRIRGNVDPGALTPIQHFGNVLSCALVKLLFGVEFTDLGPFRAIRWSTLQRLEMADQDFGWTVEMQAKAAKRGVRCTEVAVDCRRRHAGKSKVSGTVSGSVRAGIKILYTIGREALKRE